MTVFILMRDGGADGEGSARGAVVGGWDLDDDERERRSEADI